MKLTFFTLSFFLLFTTFCSANINTVTADAGPDHMICQGGQAILDGSNSTSTANYKWTVVSGDFESINTGQDQTNMPGVKPKVDSVYELTVTDPIDGCTSTDQVFVDVEIDLNPIASATATLINCDTGEIELNAASTMPPPLVPNAPITFLWFKGTNPPNGFVSQFDVANTTITENTTFTLIVVAQDACADTATVNIDLPDCNTTSTKDALLSSVIVYPNPAQHELNINLGDIDHSGLEIEILSMTGQNVGLEKFAKTSRLIKLDISNLETGLYLAKLKLDNEILFKQISVMR